MDKPTPPAHDAAPAGGNPAQPGPAPEQAANPTAGSAAAARARGRRGFIKLGAGAVPASLTLAAQPVMAWHCNSPSAAASAAISANASVQTRTAQAAITDECWSIVQWQNNTSRSGLGRPWTRLEQVTGRTRSSCTVNHVFGSTTKPYGLSNQGNNNAYTVLRSLSVGSFEAVILVARLNYLCVASVRECLGGNREDELSQMSTGLYNPSDNHSIQWGAQQIIDYLHNNWIARQ